MLFMISTSSSSYFAGGFYRQQCLFQFICMCSQHVKYQLQFDSECTCVVRVFFDSCDSCYFDLLSTCGWFHCITTLWINIAIECTYASTCKKTKQTKFTKIKTNWNKQVTTMQSGWSGIFSKQLFFFFFLLCFNVYHSNLHDYTWNYLLTTE